MKSKLKRLVSYLIIIVIGLGIVIPNPVQATLLKRNPYKVTVYDEKIKEQQNVWRGAESAYKNGIISKEEKLSIQKKANTRADAYRAAQKGKYNDIFIAEKNASYIAKPGQRSTQVENIQKKLYNLGFENQLITGYYGSITFANIVCLQILSRKIEPELDVTGYIDEKTLEIISKPLIKKSTIICNYNIITYDVTQEDNEATEEEADKVFRTYFPQEFGAMPKMSANTNVTPEVAVQILKNLSDGQPAWRPELGKNGGSSFFIMQGTPYTGIDPDKNFTIDVQIEMPKDRIIFDEKKLVELFTRQLQNTRPEAEKVFRKFNKLDKNQPLNSKMTKALNKFHEKFAERRMWDEVGAMVNKSPAKVGEVILKNSYFSHQSDGKFAVVADSSKIKIKGGINKLFEKIKTNGVPAEPGLIEAAELAATKYKWAGRVRNVFRYGGKVLIIVGVASDACRIYYAEDKIKTIIETASGWVGATAGATTFAALWTPADVAGPLAWAAHGAGTLIFGGIGYWAGTETSRVIYELIVE